MAKEKKNESVTNALSDIDRLILFREQSVLKPLYEEREKINATIVREEKYLEHLYNEKMYDLDMKALKQLPKEN